MNTTCSHTTIPVPKILAWNSDPKNPVGAEYIIMEKAPGGAGSEEFLPLLDDDLPEVFDNLRHRAVQAGRCRNLYKNGKEDERWANESSVERQSLKLVCCFLSTEMEVRSLLISIIQASFCRWKRISAF